MFVTREGAAIGFSKWPWDELYAPVVACFVNGRFHAHAPCNLEPQVVGLRGPAVRCWFRLPLARDLLERLEDDDPLVRLARLEDGQPVERADRTGQPRSHGHVEELLSMSFGGRSRLDGFPVFLGAPYDYQADVLYLDYLRRIPEPAGRRDLVEDLAKGTSVFEARERFLGSEEFRARNVGIADGCGSLVTSPVWKDLARFETPGDRLRPIRTLRIGGHADLSTPDFVAMLYGLFLSRNPDPTGSAHYQHMAETQGRAAVARELSREAAHLGLYFSVVE